MFGIERTQDLAIDGELRAMADGDVYFDAIVGIEPLA